VDFTARVSGGVDPLAIDEQLVLAAKKRLFEVGAMGLKRGGSGHGISLL
jgi:hypothetical protein